MAVAEATSLSSSPPRPEACTHPEPVEGVMAHEFSHYDGANGPEGLRRTTTHYGPVVGGLPIAAWHCEQCGLLRLSYPDGRREERLMFPGPQPGLLARPAAIDADARLRGRQAHVSGLSVSRDLAPVLAREIPAPPRHRLWRWDLPDLGVVDWLSVVGLITVGLGLLVTAVLAVYDWRTSAYVNEAVWVTVGAFASVVVLQIGAAAWRHWLVVPGITASPAIVQRETPRLDAATRAVVGFLAVAMLAMLLAAILATYDYSTSKLEWPVVGVGLGSFALAVLIAIGRATVEHFAPPDDPADML